MEKPVIAHISLGSNQGNRLAFLKTALHHIRQEIGETFLVSCVYESPAWGFKSGPFLNACVSIETLLSPSALLEKLVSIEMKMGRTRSEEQGYTDRCIDLDILLYEAEIVSHDHLKIPHPRLHLRNFVLYPLAEIHPNGMHPQFQKTIQTLKKESTDEAIPKKYLHTTWNTRNPLLQRFPFVAIEGNTGVGKTTLALKIAAHYKIAFFEETFLNNPHLKSFYEQSNKNAEAMERFFLEDRVENAAHFWRAQKSESAVADYSIYRSLIFGQQNLSAKAFSAFQELFEKKTRGVRIPDVVVYVRRPIPELLANIQKRGRSFERTISREYLEKIQNGYDLFFEKTHPFSVLKVDATGKDYIQNKHDFQIVLQCLEELCFGKEIP